MGRLKRKIKSFRKKVDVRIIRKDLLRKMQETLQLNEASVRDLALLLRTDDRHVVQVLRSFNKSRSQIRQDLFVLSVLNFKKNGFFVDFGSTNGKSLSNTYLLEKEFGWQGILAEPARIWHKELRKNRQAIIDERCVWRSSGETLSFNEVSIAELSTIDRYSEVDGHKDARRSGEKYDVQTVSLNDLLIEHQAPCVIDYLSIDTEGSEFEILNSFDFDRFKFSVITCEHNYTSAREAIYDLLVNKGYKRVFQEYSYFDDWYVREDLVTPFPKTSVPSD